MTSPERRVRQRVLVLTGIFPNRRNETWGIHVFQNVRALAAQADVRVVAPVPFVPEALARGRYRAFTGIPREDEIGGIAVVYPRFFLVPKAGRFLHGYQLFASIFATMKREIRMFRPDALLAYFAFPYGHAAVLFGALFRIPVVISCRGGDINLMTAPKLQGRLIARALRASSRVWVMSGEMRAKALALGVDAARVDVIPNGVDAARFFPRRAGEARERLGIANDGRIVVCVSRLSHEKGIDVLVDAFARMQDAGARLFVVGDGVERDALAQRARERGAGASITFAGTRPHDEIPWWLAAADVVVLASRHEGMPNAVLEALASGRPVVATAVGGTRELVTDPALGRLVPPEDVDALAGALRDALSSSWDARAIAASVAARTWDEVGLHKARSIALAAERRVPVGPGAAEDTWTAGTP
ncbi:MAG TPA: glycosyltransferase family 4 protein [Candidatus Krumholzibacteria bacterium]